MALAELAVLVPTRGRPENLQRLINAVHANARGSVDVIAGVDEDDPRLSDYMKLRNGLQDGDAIITSNERRNLVNWTNRLAKLTRGNYDFYASFGAI